MENLPDGCTQYDIDQAAGGYDPPECECVYVERTDEMDRDGCPLHSPRQDREEALLIAAGAPMIPEAKHAFALAEVVTDGLEWPEGNG